MTLLALPMQGGAMDEMVKKLLPAAGSAGLSVTQVAEVLKRVPTLEELYISILEASAAQFATIARTVLVVSRTTRPGVLFHLHRGQDRTGLAAAILLLVAEVPREAIVADYTLTEKNLARGFAEALTGLITSLGVPLTPALTTLRPSLRRRPSRRQMDWIIANHGDVAGYLRSGGMTAEEIGDLRRILRGE